MKVLVTGASGMCGGEIAGYLDGCGHEVTGTYKTHKIRRRYRMVCCDMTREIALDEAFDVIVHCAGVLPYQNPTMREYVSGNIDSMRNLLDFAQKKCIHRMIYLSTIGVYGEFVDETVDEDSPKVEPDGYGMTKYMAEKLLAEDKQIKGISLRCPGIIGKYARAVWLSEVAEKMKRGETVKVSTPEFMTQNIVHVNDLARFIEVLMNKDTWKYGELLIASREKMKVGEIIRLMKEQFQSESKIVEISASREPFSLNPRRALEEGYAPMGIIEAVRKYCMEILGR